MDLKLPMDPSFCLVSSKPNIVRPQMDSFLKLTKGYQQIDEYSFWFFFSLITHFWTSRDISTQKSISTRLLGPFCVSNAYNPIKNQWFCPLSIPLLWGFWLCCEILLRDFFFHIKVIPWNSVFTNWNSVRICYVQKFRVKPLKEYKYYVSKDSKHSNSLILVLACRVEKFTNVSLVLKKMQSRGVFL